MASTPLMAMSRVPSDMRLLHNDLLLLRSSSGSPQHHAREEEEDAVHDAEREAGFQQGTVLVDVHAEPVQRETAQITQRDVQARGLGDGAATHFRDEAQLVDSGYQGADEAQVHEGDEQRVGPRAAVGEDGI